jgi:hypothetical protein
MPYRKCKAEMAMRDAACLESSQLSGFSRGLKASKHHHHVIQETSSIALDQIDVFGRQVRSG